MKKEIEIISLYNQLNYLIKRENFFHEILKVINNNIGNNNIEISKIKLIINDLERGLISPKNASINITQIFDQMKSKNISNDDIEIYKEELTKIDTEIFDIMNLVPNLLNSKCLLYHGFLKNYYNYSKNNLAVLLLKYQNNEELDYDPKVELYNKIILWLYDEKVIKSYDIDEILEIISRIFNGSFSDADYEKLLLFIDKYQKEDNTSMVYFLSLITDFVNPQKTIVRKKNKK